jgi:hypothetical protein
LMGSSCTSNEWRSLVGDTVQRKRRAEARHPASGEVKLYLYEELGICPAIVEGELVDRSMNGCKIRHTFGQLKPGQRVTVAIEMMELDAIVVWTKSLLDHHESGFSFLR